MQRQKNEMQKHLKEIEEKAVEIKEWKDKFEATDRNGAVKDDSSGRRMQNR